MDKNNKKIIPRQRKNGRVYHQQICPKINFKGYISGRMMVIPDESSEILQGIKSKGCDKYVHLHT